MKVLLAAINAKYIHSNLAVYSLKSYAKRYREHICIAEYTINQPVEEILADIFLHQPDFLCFSCYLWNIQYVEQLLGDIPKILPSTQVWLGGPEVSYDAASVLARFPHVKGVMCGEGEATFSELADLFWRRESEGLSEHAFDSELSHIAGLVYRSSEGEILHNPPRPVLDLSAIPFVYDEGDGWIENFENRIVYYESSRGCPFQCSYCLSSIDKCLRFRSLDLVREELQFFIDHRVPQVKFVDRTFNCSHSHAMAIWKYIAEHDNGITNFHFEVSADLLSEEEICLIKTMRPGLIQLEIGVQSANETVIREIRRTMRLDQVRQNVSRIKEQGNVHQHLDLIAGLPYEDYDSFARSFDEVYRMEPEQLQLGFLKVLKGSLMYEKAEEYGLMYQERPPYEVLSTRWLSYSDILRLKKTEEMVEVYYNSSQFRHTMALLAGEAPSPFRLYESLGEFYEREGLFGRSHSRIARYEILYRFIQENVCPQDMKLYRERLTLDLYLRENVKNRPPFLGECTVTKEESAAFYKKEAAEKRYLKDYEGFDGRQMYRMTHLERIGGRLLLFDYLNRNPLTQDAAVYEVQ